MYIGQGLIWRYGRETGDVQSRMVLELVLVFNGEAGVITITSSLAPCALHVSCVMSTRTRKLRGMEIDKA